MADSRPSAVLICDMQSRFEDSIYQFKKVENTICHLADVCSLLALPAIVTTQNAAKLGNTLASISERLPREAFYQDKSMFSMLTPEVSEQLSKFRPSEVVIVGIESHICVTQTALDLLNEGYKVIVLADAVSSFSLDEHEAALLRLRQSGVHVMSFESWLFGTVKTASHPKFKQVSGIVKLCRLARSSNAKALL